MGNSHQSRTRKKPDLDPPAAITEPLQSGEQTAASVPNAHALPSVTESFPNTDYKSWDSGTETERRNSRPNSLEILIKQALENYVSEDDIDPKFGMPRQDEQGEAGYELSELPVEREEDVFE